MILRRVWLLWVLSRHLDAPLVLTGRFLLIVPVERGVLWKFDRVFRLACLSVTFCKSLALERFAP